VKESVERWDLINDIGRKRLLIALENVDENRRKVRMEKYEGNVMRDDITAVVCYLQNIID
jgi:hypothetical protein